MRAGVPTTGGPGKTENQNQRRELTVTAAVPFAGAKQQPSPAKAMLTVAVPSGWAVRPGEQWARPLASVLALQVCARSPLPRVKATSRPASGAVPSSLSWAASCPGKPLMNLVSPR
jgi:hypothetical protein